MVEIEGFEAILSQINWAKELRNIGRLDIIEQFSDELSWDSYYESLIRVLSSIFSGFNSSYDDCDDAEVMVFEDDVISNYFIHAWEYGQLHKFPYDQNPYISQAQDEARNCLTISSCTDWKLLSYSKSKKAARKSKLVVCNYVSCGCNAQEGIVFGLIRLYSWFTQKCAEFNSMKDVYEQPKKNASAVYAKPNYQEVMAA